MKVVGMSALTIGMTAVVIGNAFYRKKQFYPSVVYITKSNPCMAVIYMQSFIFVLMFGKLMRKVFLGTLRPAEFEHFMERFWYALTETCLAFTVFRDDFNPKFVALFTILLFLKSFHWLAEDRVDYMERSPVIGWIFHVRVTALLSVLTFLDYKMIMHAYQLTINKGPTVQLVFGFEYAILITMVANIMIKYMWHVAEMRSDNPENKAVCLLYTEVVIGLIRVILYILFVVIMVRIYTLPLFAFRPMYYTLRNFKKAVNDVILSRRAIRNMNTLYPDATEEELASSDNICIICREDMVNNSKKLPCGHIFHTACLRSWFQRQQTCPTCRLNILRTATIVNPPQQPQVAANGRNIPATANVVINNQPSPNANIDPNLTSGSTAIPNLSEGHADNIRATQANAFNFTHPLNSFMPVISPFIIPSPPIPPNLATLSDEELRALEGNERQHIEERIKLLRNIQLLLNASVALMNQYSAISTNLHTFGREDSLFSTSDQSHQESVTTNLGEDATTQLLSTNIEVPSTSGTIINPTAFVENATHTENVLVADPKNENFMSDESISNEVESKSENSELRRRRLEKFEPKL